MSIIVVTIFLIILLFNLFILINTNKAKILNNTYAGKISLSGLSKEEAIEKLDEYFNNNLNNEVILKYKDFEFTIISTDIGFQINSEAIANRAYNLGREENIIDQNRQVLSSFISKQEISLDYIYDRSKYDEFLDAIHKVLPEELNVKESSYKIDKSNLIIYAGEEGFNLDKERLLIELIKIFKLENPERILEMPLMRVFPKEINLSEIKTEIFKEPVDAKYNKKTGKITVEVNGIDFELSLEESEELLKEKKDKYIIPLKITKPKVTKASIIKQYFSYTLSSALKTQLKNQYKNSTYDDILGDHISNYKIEEVDRTTNLIVASKAINGYILYPGYEFSFNSFVGRTTAADGYKKTFGYSGGKKVPMWGGGVCQISSNIYVAALEADLLITERFNHGCPVDYMPPGLDSATDWGSCDFKFINNRDYPIKILTSTADGVSTAKILGLKEKSESTIEIKSSKSNIVKFKTTYITDTKLEKGTSKEEVKGLDGFIARSYKYYYKNGNLIKKELISVDKYRPLNAIIRHNP